MHWITSSKITRAVSLSIFILMSVVSLVIFLTEKHLAISDFLIVIASPFALGFLFYLEGLLHHE